MVNLSLSSATFPHSQKLARVLPLLKKPDMDVFDLKSYRPVSNLTFISKFLERLVARRLIIHSELNQLLPRYQSAYRPHHSTETALTRVTNDARYASLTLTTNMVVKYCLQLVLFIYLTTVSGFPPQ